jgi:hypothetical protein
MIGESDNSPWSGAVTDQISGRMRRLHQLANLRNGPTIRHLGRC